MARPKKKAATGASGEVSIEELTAAFLKSGGKIEQIPTGVSGQTSMAGSKHINLGNKNKESTAPASTVSDSTAPASTVSDSTAPASTVPASTTPDSIAPVSTTPTSSTVPSTPASIPTEKSS